MSIFKSYPVSKGELINFTFGVIIAELIGCVLVETGIADLEIYKLLYPFIYVYGLVILIQTFVRWLS
jgi:hypothetical protein